MGSQILPARADASLVRALRSARGPPMCTTRTTPLRRLDPGPRQHSQLALLVVSMLNGNNLDVLASFKNRRVHNGY